MKSDILGAFAYWVVKQSPYDTLNITAALEAFDKYINPKFFLEPKEPVEFSYEELSALLTEDTLEAIPEVEILNHYKISEGAEFNNRHNVYNADFDFIDLGALARNVFYMVLREIITQE